MLDLNKIIKKNLNELSIKEKQPFGFGMEHKIYASEKNPDRLFKVGDFDVVDHWVHIFRKNPDLFPKVYRAGKFPKYPKLYYVEIEKLNTQELFDDWNYCELELEEMGVLDLDYQHDINSLYIDGKIDSEITSEIIDRLSSRSKKFITELLDLIKKCESAVGGTEIIDAHKYNFGYDKDGIMKCLDI